MPPRPPSSGAAEPLPLGGGRAGAVVALVAALTLARLWAAAGTGLTHDEAYYWLWSKNLAFGYFDLPPMVAVLIRASTAVFGESEFGPSGELGIMPFSRGRIRPCFRFG